MTSSRALHSRSYDRFGRLETVRDGHWVASAFADTARVTRTYDERGRIHAQILTSPLPQVGTYTDTYVYDDADRLTGWERAGDGAADVTFDYDAAGNLRSRTDGAHTTTFTANADNRLTRAETGSEVTTYTSDTYGRRTSAISSVDGTTTYTWDALGHLTQVASADATETYAYGISGMRERVTRETSAGTSWTESVWDGSTLVAERDSDGTLYRYVWGPDRTPLALEVTRPGETAALYSFHTDAAGSVIALTAPDGTVAASHRYGPYGEVTYSGGSDAALAERNPLRYRSYYYDTATALYYLPARYYEPATVRFLSPDPAAPSAGDPLSLNAFAYCVGDPVNLADPSGAIIDIDGDGRVDPKDLDHANRAARHEAFGRLVAKYQAEAERHRNRAATFDRLRKAAWVMLGVCVATEAVLCGAWVWGVYGAGAAGSAAVVLPDKLAQGANATASVYTVYVGRVGQPGVRYVGITCNYARRAAEWAGRYDLRPVAEGLTKGEARAVEQAIIAANPQFNNLINSISPNHPYYGQAVQWGQQTLSALNGRLVY